MQLSVKWLSEYVDLTDVDYTGLNDALVPRGIKLTAAEDLFARTNKIQVGLIKDMVPHPDAENLWVMQVDAGDEQVQIVTGATNCSVGKYAPVVRKNGRIADGTKIKRGRLRGVESEGMLCSLEELGYASQVVPDPMVDNIFILNDTHHALVPGTAIESAVSELRDTVLTFDILTEKPLPSVRGVAGELAVALNKEFRDVEPQTIAAGVDAVKPEWEIVVNHENAQETPDWVKLRLMKCGVKPISFIKDIEAYLHLEFGDVVKIMASDVSHEERHFLIKVTGLTHNKGLIQFIAEKAEGLLKNELKAL